MTKRAIILGQVLTLFVLTGCSVVAELTELAERSAPAVEFFEADPDGGFSPLEVLLEWRVSDLDSDALTCTFDYGDGSEAQIDNCDEVTDAFYAYGEPGSYVVTLTVDDGGAQSSRTEAVIVAGRASASDPLAITSFVAQPNRGVAPLLTALSWTLQADRPATCTLSFGDGSDDEVVENCHEVTDAVHTFEESGGYRVILKVTNGEVTARASLIVVSEQGAQAP